MMFDPFAWSCGFVLNQLSARLLAPSPSGQLRARLQTEAEAWAEGLPPTLAVRGLHVFGEAQADPDPATRPARFRLQGAIQTGLVPPESVWLDAFVEHWTVKKAELGGEGNAFFQQPLEAARGQLSELAHRLYRCCQADPEFSRRTIAAQLGEILQGQEEERSHREQQQRLPYYARDLSLTARQIFLERPHGWEGRLFATVLAHEIALQGSLLRDYQSGLSWGPRIQIGGLQELRNWFVVHLADVQQLTANLNTLFGRPLAAAFGPAGSPGNPEAIIDVAQKVGEVYRRLLEWALDVRRVSADPAYTRMLGLAERFVERPIGEIREFAAALGSAMEAAVRAGENQVSLTLTVTFPEDLLHEWRHEMEGLTAAPPWTGR